MEISTTLYVSSVGVHTAWFCHRALRLHPRARSPRRSPRIRARSRAVLPRPQSRSVAALALPRDSRHAPYLRRAYASSPARPRPAKFPFLTRRDPPSAPPSLASHSRPRSWPPATSLL
ncbi:Pyrophosphate--fructose 6-phosphate 1-phosphotransferase subunit alpha 2 [Zea mays]|uniref:Pyrophosphate--fructose 6-phosphate 1-phosphotransferase subunit alpha 2 n=1 Tax=Zea mays TaxID=4577 RepID=A0A1D6LP85_MAIZE|nr:Pyrophosphate--fructose 6-phosphate 1-phosphotransferase subunit alpha 2 [Zea mays]